MQMEKPLDFELDDPLLRDPPSPARPNKRGKVIGLDDLLTDHFNEESKFGEKNSKDLKSKKNYTFDDDEDRAEYNKERELSKFMERCQKQVYEIVTEEDIPLWGLQVFGHQKPPPELDSSGLKGCKLLHFLAKERNIFKDDVEGDSFLEGLLKNGWLLKLVSVSGYLEDSIALWAFNKMMYSSEEELHSSACDFCCSVVLSKRISIHVSKSNCFSYPAIKCALDTYGYLFGHYSSSSTKNLVKTGGLDLEACGPPSNIKSWVKFVSSICKSRGSNALLSSAEAEELLSIILSLFLERQLQGLSFLLGECLRSIVSFFSDEEWHGSCKNVTIAVAHRIPSDLNCLHVIESISLANSRGKNLRSALAFQVLIHFFDEGVTNGKDIVKFLLSISLKDKTCDFFKVYIYLVLVENWLCFDPQVEEKPKILEMWSKFLRNCSTQITSTDWRSYASKVRNKASYLIQSQTW